MTPTRAQSRSVVLLGLLCCVLGVSLPAARIGIPAAYADAPPAGVLLPSGRLVLPAGSPLDTTRQTGDRTVDLGDFPLGLAVDPTGRYAVATDNGFGTGVNPGFNSDCDLNQDGTNGMGKKVACPGVPASKAFTGTVHVFDEGLDLVDLSTGAERQVGAVKTSYNPSFAASQDKCTGNYNCFGIGVAWSPTATRHDVYATGAGSDEIYRFTETPAADGTTTLTLAQTLPIPSAAAALSVAAGDATPAVGAFRGNPVGLTVTPDGSKVIVTDVFDATIEVLGVDATSGALSLTSDGLLAGGIPGPVPVNYAYAVTASNTTAYVTAEGLGAVYTVPLATVPPASLVVPTTDAVGPAPATVTPVGDHPTGLALSPDGTMLAVANANADTVSLLGVLAGGALNPVATTVATSVVNRGTAANSPKGSVPDAVAFSPDGTAIYVALAGDDAVAVITASTATVAGFIPTAWYPTALSVTPTGRLIVVNAKGYGSRYVPGLDGTPAASPGSGAAAGSETGAGQVPSADYYDGDNMPGVLQDLTPPDAAHLAAYSQTAATGILHASGLDQRTADNPIPAAVGGVSPITHVVYVVRENRTFDQVLGDESLIRKDVDADPSDQVLAAATPNAHGVASQFAIADHFFSDGEASVQGHWWTSSANSSDYMEKSWRQYYSARNRPYDPIGTVVNPPNCSIFQAMTAKIATNPTFTSRDFGELVGAATPNTSSVATNTCSTSGAASPPAEVPYDPTNYKTQLALVPDDRNRASAFLSDSGLTVDGANAGNGNSLANFNYVLLSEDHTSGFAGTASTGPTGNDDGDKTPRAQVATNDAALGMILQGLSKSSDWSSTAVFVVEDDSQDGYDHVDGHRNVLLVASPYTKHVSGDGCAVPGYVGHNHYDQASVLHTIELILGVNPLSAYDSGAAPLYDLFQPKATAASLTAADLAPFTIKPPPPFERETVASVLNPTAAQAAAQNAQPVADKSIVTPSMAAGLAAESKGLDVTQPDVSEAPLEQLLWQSVRTDPVPFAIAQSASGSGTDDSPGARTLMDQGATVTADEVRSGSAPALSTVTGLPVDPTQPPVCAAPVALTAPVAPGAKTAAVHPIAIVHHTPVRHTPVRSSHPVTAPRGPGSTLASTGLQRNVVILGLVLLLGGLFLLRRRRV